MRGAEKYEAMFSEVASNASSAFVPFAVIGDPDPATSLAIGRTLVESGADALELAIPFSDPVADGPVIQRAHDRALAGGTRVADAWQVLRTLSTEFPRCPIGLLVYANLALHARAETFYRCAADAGVDSVLVADAPLIESGRLERIAIENGIAPVLIASPNVSDERLAAIASRSRGYVYVTSRPGVTGTERAGLPGDAASVVRRLGGIDKPVPPALLGFGIGTPEHVRQAIGLGVAGVISGSAVVSRIERGSEAEGHSRSAMLDELTRFVRRMKEAGTTGA